MSKYEIKQSFNGTDIIYAENRGISIKRGERAFSLSVDIRRAEGQSKSVISFCIVNSRRGGRSPVIGILEGWTFEDLSDFIIELLSLAKPLHLFIDDIGISKGLWDYLIPKLYKHNIYVSKEGNVSYFLYEENMKEAIVNGDNKNYDSYIQKSDYDKLFDFLVSLNNRLEILEKLIQDELK